MMVTIEFAPGVKVCDKSFGLEWGINAVVIEREGVMYSCERFDMEKREILSRSFYGSDLDLIDGQSNEIFVTTRNRGR
jgi:hypothetical protein